MAPFIYRWKHLGIVAVTGGYKNGMPVSISRVCLGVVACLRVTYRNACKLLEGFVIHIGTA